MLHCNYTAIAIIIFNFKHLVNSYIHVLKGCHLHGRNFLHGQVRWEWCRVCVRMQYARAGQPALPGHFSVHGGHWMSAGIPWRRDLLGRRLAGIAGVSQNLAFCIFSIHLLWFSVQNMTSMNQIAGEWWVVKGQNCGQEGWPSGLDWYPCQGCAKFSHKWTTLIEIPSLCPQWYNWQLSKHIKGTSCIHGSKFMCIYFVLKFALPPFLPLSLPSGVQISKQNMHGTYDPINNLNPVYMRTIYPGITAVHHFLTIFHL